MNSPVMARVQIGEFGVAYVATGLVPSHRRPTDRQLRRAGAAAAGMLARAEAQRKAKAVSPERAAELQAEWRTVRS